MTTLATLSSQIADDLARSDLTSQISDAITAAITHFQDHRFFYNETRLATFTTTSGTSIYTSSEDADIPLFVELDAVFINDGSVEREMDWTSPDGMQWLLGSTSSSGVPGRYSYFERSFRLYPVPNGTYTVRPIGLIEKAAPASDSEADNVWMTFGRELIRCKAKSLLAMHVLYDAELAAVMGDETQPLSAMGRAYKKLRRETSKKQSGGKIVGTDF